MFLLQRRHSAWISLTASVLASISSVPVRAQCADVSGDFGTLGPNRFVRDAEVFDLGSGPRLIVAGLFTSIGAESIHFVAQWDGARWDKIGSGLLPDASGGGGVVSLTVFDDGNGPRLCIAGNFEVPGSSGVRDVARWNGTAWEAVGAALPPSQQALGSLTVFDDGQGPELYGIGGALATQHNVRPYLWRLRAGSWSPITGPESGPFDETAYFSSLAVYDHGAGPSLYVGGQFTLLGGGSCFNLASWDAGGWTSRSIGSYENRVDALRTHDDGAGSQLYVGGTVGLQRWNGAAFTPIAGAGSVTALLPMPAVPGTAAGLWVMSYTGAGGSLRLWDGATLDLVPGTEVSHVESIATATAIDLGQGLEAFVGGAFESLGGVPASNLARRNGLGWERMVNGNGLRTGPPFYQQPLVRTVFEDSGATPPKLLIGGVSFVAGGAQPLSTCGAWDGGAWSPIGSLSGNAASLARFDFGQGPELVAGGSFNTIEGTRRVVRFDGSTWTAVGNVTPSNEIQCVAVFDDGNGARLYAGGLGLHRWNGSSWEAVATSGSVGALLVHDDGSGPALYVGGFISGMSGVPAHQGVVRFDGTNGSVVGPNIAATGEIHALTTYVQGSVRKLVAAGRFTSIAGVAANAIAAWDGVAWTPLGDGIQGGPPPLPEAVSVRALATFDDGLGNGPALYAGGLFTRAGGNSAAGLARWDGSSWSEAFGGVRQGLVDALTVVQSPALGGRALAIGGTFLALGDQPSNHIAMVAGCDAIGDLFCFGDRSSGPCPCGNFSATPQRAGCLNSLGTGGTLRARGMSSIAHDSLELAGGGMTNSSVLYFQAVQRTSGVPFGDGIKCTAGPFVRLGTKVNVGGASLYPEPVDVPIATKGFVTSSATRHYQARYRNVTAFCTSESFNYTNAVSIVWEL